MAHMSNARVSLDSSGKASQGPAWGLKEQLKRFDSGGGKDVTGSTGGQQKWSAAATKSKIRVSVTGPGLADKIRQVNIPAGAGTSKLLLLSMKLCGFAFTQRQDHHAQQVSVSVHTLIFFLFTEYIYLYNLLVRFYIYVEICKFYGHKSHVTGHASNTREIHSSNRCYSSTDEHLPHVPDRAARRNRESIDTWRIKWHVEILRTWYSSTSYVQRRYQVPGKTRRPQNK